MLCEWLLNPGLMDDGSKILMGWDAGILDLESDTLSPTQSEAASVILRSATHLSSLVDDIVDMTKSSFGELTLELEKVNISPIAAEVIETLRPQIEGKGQVLEDRLATDLASLNSWKAADETLRKPIDFELLLRLIEELTSGRSLP